MTTVWVTEEPHCRRLVFFFNNAHTFLLHLPIQMLCRLTSHRLWKTHQHTRAPSCRCIELQPGQLGRSARSPAGHPRKLYNPCVSHFITKLVIINHVKIPQALFDNRLTIVKTDQYVKSLKDRGLKCFNWPVCL